MYQKWRKMLWVPRNTKCLFIYTKSIVSRVYALKSVIVSNIWKKNDRKSSVETLYAFFDDKIYALQIVTIFCCCFFSLFHSIRPTKQSLYKYLLHFDSLYCVYIDIMVHTHTENVKTQIHHPFSNRRRWIAIGIFGLELLSIHHKWICDGPQEHKASHTMLGYATDNRRK